MENVKQILAAILIIILFSACEKSEDDPMDNLKSSISAKWDVDNSGKYVSFEFNESGNYIIVKDVTTTYDSKQIVLFGTYQILENNDISLSGFGTLNIIDIEKNGIRFSIQLIDNTINEIFINASRQAEIASSTKTDLLCKTWEMLTVNGEPAVGTDMEITSLFSKSGTYFVSYAIPEDENAGGLAKWRWKDETETHLLYSWAEIPVWEKADSVHVSELTSTKLEIIDGDDTYILQPKSTINSIMDISSVPSDILPSDFLHE